MERYYAHVSVVLDGCWGVFSIPPLVIDLLVSDGPL